MNTDDLMYYYKAVVRPVLEYGCALWHSSLTQEQKHRLDSVQRRAIRIIGCTEMEKTKLSPLRDRRNEQARCLFHRIQDPKNCIHSMLPPQRDIQTDRLRHIPSYPIPFARTERYRRSFLVNSLSHYQI